MSLFLNDPVWVKRDNKIRPGKKGRIWILGSGNTDFLENLIESIAQAKEMICISSFLIFEPRLQKALEEASRRNVRVYILSAPETIIDKIEDEISPDSDQQSLRKQYLESLSKLGEHVYIRSAEYFHAKYILIDPRAKTQAKGFISTANFNKALIESLELVVELNTDEIENLFRFFLWGFWEASQRENIQNPKKLTPVPKKPSFVQLPNTIKTILATLPPNRNSRPRINTIKKELSKLFKKDLKRIYVAFYGFDKGHELVEEILRLSEKTKVVIFTRVRENKDQLEVIKQFAKKHIDIFAHPKLHAKFVVAELESGQFEGIITSANLQKRGIDEGYEVGIKLRKNDAKTLFEIADQWEHNLPWKHWTNSYWPEVNSRILYLKNDGRYEEAEIIKEEEKRIPVKIRCLSDTPVKPDLDPNQIAEETLIKRKQIPQQIKYTIRLEPPYLPAKAKRLEKKTEEEKKRAEHRQGIPLDVYYINSKGKAKQLFIVITNKKEFEKALKLKRQEQFLNNACIVFRRKEK